MAHTCVQILYYLPTEKKTFLKKYISHVKIEQKIAGFLYGKITTFTVNGRDLEKGF